MIRLIFCIAMGIFIGALALAWWGYRKAVGTGTPSGVTPILGQTPGVVL